MARTGMRLDQWLVAHGYAATRSRAQWLIEAGHVWINEQPCGKAAAAVSDHDRVKVRGTGLPYVSRGGLKLERALKAFRLEVAGLVLWRRLGGRGPEPRGILPTLAAGFCLLLALRALETAASADSATGGVDRRADIFPIVKLVTASGIATLSEKRLAKIFKAQLA